MVLIVSIALSYTYTYGNYINILRKRMIACLCAYGHTLSDQPAQFRKSDPLLMRQENCQQVDCKRVMEGPTMVLTVSIGLYIHIHKELPIYKKESGCIPPSLGDTLLDSRFE